MASVATAPTNSSDDHSGTKINDKEKEYQEEEIAKDSDSDATDMKDLGKVITAGVKWVCCIHPSQVT
jgi:hypothetical protein